MPKIRQRVGNKILAKMNTLKSIVMSVLTFIVCCSLVACGGNGNNTQEGQKALDAAVKAERNAAVIHNQYLESREYYKRQGDQKNAEYYDRMVKEQSKEVDRLHQKSEQIRKDTYGNVFK